MFRRTIESLRLWAALYCVAVTWLVYVGAYA